MEIRKLFRKNPKKITHLSNLGLKSFRSEESTLQAKNSRVYKNEEVEVAHPVQIKSTNKVISIIKLRVYSAGKKFYQ